MAMMAAAAAVGALAIGALAIGRLTIRRLRIGSATIVTLEIQEPSVRRLHAAELIVSGSLKVPGGVGPSASS